MMADDPKKPNKRIQFRKGDDANNKKIQFRPDEDPRTIADKDATAPTHKPKQVKSLGAASFSPMGTIAIKGTRNVNISVISEEIPDREELVRLDREDITVQYENKGLTVLVRKEDEMSSRGIDGGYISRLTVTQGEVGNEEILAHFDKGQWLKEPETFVEKQVVEEAKAMDNGIDREFKTPDRENDPEL